MRLSLVGLIVLAGGAWAQHQFIESDTELLALPSDQLIHSNVELEAVETVGSRTRKDIHHLALGDPHSAYFTSLGELPFGARLPGYERIQYAYGYTIPEEQSSQVLSLTTTTESTKAEQLATNEFKFFNLPAPRETRLVPPSAEYLPPWAMPGVTGPLVSDTQTPGVKTGPPSAIFDSYLPPVVDFNTTAPSPSPPIEEYLPPEIGFGTEPATTPTTEHPIIPPVRPENESSPPSLAINSKLSIPIPPSGEYLPPLLQPPIGVRSVEMEEITEVVNGERATLPLGLQRGAGNHITFDYQHSVKQPVTVLAEHKVQPLRASAESQPQMHYASAETLFFPSSSGVREPQQEAVRVFSGERSQPPISVVSELRDPVVEVPRGSTLAPPISVIRNVEDNAVYIKTSSSPTQATTIRRDNSECLQSTECQDYEVCLKEKCVNGCVITDGVCVGHSVCRTRRHTPACVCLNMSTAITVRVGGREQYDCIPMAMTDGVEGQPGRRRPDAISGRILNRGQRPSSPVTVVRGTPYTYHSSPVAVLSFSYAPLLPIAPFSVYPRERVSTFRQGGFRDDFGSSSGNPCSPSPCGPNTSCDVSPIGHARCRCLEGYVTDRNTIEGCKHQCLESNDCPDDYRCRNRRCVRVCESGACGINADCTAKNHEPKCSCPHGFRGDANSRCSRFTPEIRAAPPALRLDPCFSSPCGENADCKDREGRAVCTCPFGYTGDPLTRCNRGECTENNHCPSHQLCRQLQCYNPCSDTSICGANSECRVKDNQVICTCRVGFNGDAVVGCSRFDPATLCNPSPCGEKTNCRVENERAVCSCFDNYRGDPLTRCIPDCERNEDCSPSQACRANICVNPCSTGACGIDSICEVRNYQPICKCPEYYQGDPYTRCTAECFDHDDCPNHQACYKLKCINPCDGACGTGADCKVTDHQPICSCPKGYTGHPFENCRPFTDADFCNPNPCGESANCEPGTDRNGERKAVCTCPHGYIGNPITRCTRGQCNTENDCPSNQICYFFECKDPCVSLTGSVCGENAQCTVRNRMPVCSCPVGYTGDPRTECSPASNSRRRFSGGRFN